MTGTQKKNPKQSTTRRAGPKRSEASKIAVQKAALEELTSNGWRNFSVDRVAKNAKASKQTIYRWWPTPACLVVEAALEGIPKGTDPNTGLKERLLAIVTPLIQDIRLGDGAHKWRGVLLAAADTDEANEIFRKWITETYKKPIRFVLAENTNKNLIRRDWDIDFIVESLLGPVWHRIVAMRAPIPESYLAALVDTVADSLRKTDT